MVNKTKRCDVRTCSCACARWTYFYRNHCRKHRVRASNQRDRFVAQEQNEPVHANNRRLTLFFLSAYGNRTLEYSRFSAPQKNSFLKKIRRKRSRPDESRWSCTTAKAPYQPTAASGMKRRIGLARPFGTTNRRSLSVCAPERRLKRT